MGWPALSERGENTRKWGKIDRWVGGERATLRWLDRGAYGGEGEPEAEGGSVVPIGVRATKSTLR